MAFVKTTHNRRSFLKISAASTGGLMVGFSWAVSCSPKEEETLSPPSAWFDFNAYVSVADNGQVTIMSPNPEIGQNIKTAFPMIVAEELDVPWSSVTVKQAALNTNWYERQVAGGSQSIRYGWDGLRMAGGTARHMLMQAAAEQWGVNITSLKTADGVITNANGDQLTYGEVASAASQREAPIEVQLKEPHEYKIIGHPTRNVEIENIITGKPLYGIDTQVEGMQYATALGSSAFGQRLKSFDDTAARQVTGVTDVFKITVPRKEEDRFVDKVVVTANSTWAAIKGQRALTAEWEQVSPSENSDFHDQTLSTLLDQKPEEPARSDGNVEARFAEADEVIERVYEAPFLPHNCLEPMNFFADVTDTKAEFLGPIQTPENTRKRLAELLEREEKDIVIDMSRMGGGFGRRLYGDFAIDAAEISRIAKTPIQLIFTREDDMSAGIYRPASKYKIKASLKDNRITGYQLAEAAINGNMYSVLPNNFPAGAIDDYRVNTQHYDSNISTGAWRAPYTNFLASAEQSFFDELAEIMKVDPVQLRLQLLEGAHEVYTSVKRDEEKAMSMVDEEVLTEEEKAAALAEIRETHVRRRGNYVPEKFIGVIKLAAEKADWGNAESGVYQGFSAYYSHNSYVAEVADVVMEAGKPVVKKITAAVDCGIVVNPLAAENLVVGGVIDGVGHAMYGDYSFTDGRPEATNFDKYRLIRMTEAPAVDVHFVQNTDSPTGLGEPTLPPAGGAIANAIYAATGKRLYRQPYAKQDIVLG